MIRPRLSDLGRDRRGVTGLIVVFCITAMVMLMLAAIDLIRVQMVKARAQAAIDAAVLAAGHGLGSADCKSQGDAYFSANLGDGYLGSSISQSLTFVVDGTTVTAANASSACTVTNATGDLVTASATVSVPLLSVGFIALGSVSIPVSNEAQRTVASNSLELVLAMDNTGSMGSDNKLTNMQSAAKTLVGNLLGNDTTGAKIYIGLVPFTETVRAGKDSAGTVHSGWLSGGAPKHFSSASAWGGCFFERKGSSGNFALDATTPSALTFEDWAVSHYDWVKSYPCNFSLFGACFGGYSSTPSSQSWSTSQPPPTSVSNCSSSGCNYVASSQSYGQYYTISTSNTWSSNYYGCIQTPVTFLTSSQSTLTTAINAMVANGSTMISSGILWAWRMLDPDWRNSSANTGWGNATLPQDASTTLTKAIVLLTDGNNAPSYLGPGTETTSSTTASAKITATPYYLLGPYQGTPQASSGSAVNGSNNILFNVPTSSTTYQLHITNGGDPDSTTAADAILTQACTNAKAAGITIFTIALNTDGTISSATKSLLQGCASQSSYYYNVTDASDLTSVFSNIGGQLSELTLVQ